MRAILPFILLDATGWADEAFGIWKMNATRSTFTGDTQPKSFTVRIERHAKGEVFTLDRSEADGRTTTFSSILYLDGKERDYREPGCSGTQSSRRVDRQTVEIMRKCASGEWARFVRRTAAQSKELILDITEQHLDGRRFERRMVLEKQWNELLN